MSDKPNCPNSDAVKQEHRGCVLKVINGRTAYVCPLCFKTVYVGYK